jgi:hypothetical protein
MGEGVYPEPVASHMPALSTKTAEREGTLFSQERFIQAVVRAGTPNFCALKLHSTNSTVHLFGLQQNHKLSTRSVSFAPFGCYAYPIHMDGTQDSVSALVGQLRTFRTRSFYWSVRFDHSSLADQLERCGLDGQEYTTQVLYLDRPYDALFRAYSRATRKEIRRADRKGVSVYQTTDLEDVALYYALFNKVVSERESWSGVYEQSLFNELIQLREDVVFLVAKLNRRLIAGGWFFRDGNSLFYWHCAMDYAFKQYFPYYAIVNRGIQLACTEEMETFNMGASMGISSIEQFKSFWGTKKVPCWMFTWENPFWSSLLRIRGRVTW